MLSFKNINVLPLLYYTSDIHQKLKNSNKVVLPQVILDRILREVTEIQYPMIFKINTEIINFHVGVEEFSPNLNLYLPNNLMQNNFIEMNQKVTIEYISPPKGSFIKIKPYQTEFTKIMNPKYILEKNIVKYYPVLTKNEIITINYDNHNYEIEIKECKPNYVISTNNTDLVVDFDEPYDYKEYTEKHKRISKPKKKKVYKSKNKFNNKFRAFSGKGNKLG